ncbi:MAG: hypothetical protein Q9219_001965 [cf. Caloplaca sp. 3 TL-2023]
MYLTASLIAISSLLGQALAAPGVADVQARGSSALHFSNKDKTDGFPALIDNCNRDNLLRSFVDPRYSSSASAFCSAYIKPTIRATTTVTTTATSNAKRDVPAATYPPERLSSACSCILTAVPQPTTVVTTVVATVTSTRSGTCSVATPIVKNGDFEGGNLAPWALTYVTPPLPEYSQYLSYGVKTAGYGGSKYALVAKDEAASSYNELDFEQTLTVCAGAKYKFTAKYYLTDPGDQNSKVKERAPKQVYVYVYVDGNLIAGSTDSDPAGPPIVWRTFSKTFTATSNTAQLKVAFVATDFLGVEWGLDNVVVAPA